MEYTGFNADDFARDTFFIKWVKGDPDAAWFWQTFKTEHPEKEKDIQTAKELVEQMLAQQSQHQLDSMALESMRNKLILTLTAKKVNEREVVALKREPNRALHITWLRIAASILLIVSVASLYRATNFQQKHKILTVDGTQVTSVMTDSTEQRVNPRGQKSVMLLTDGTKVWLNADSKLTYPIDFLERPNREVYLEGEAFFDVVPNAAKPFIVHTSDVNIRVLGTSFNVKSYTNDLIIETTLVEGKVEIDNLRESPAAPEKIILMPNQKAEFSKESHAIQVQEVGVGEVVAWREDRLVFKAEKFSEVVKQLERWYNVKIHITEDANMACPLTASIENENLEQVLELLAVTHKVSFTINKNDVYIKGNICK